MRKGVKVGLFSLGCLGFCEKKVGVNMTEKQALKKLGKPNITPFTIIAQAIYKRHISVSFNDIL